MYPCLQYIVRPAFLLILFFNCIFAVLGIQPLSPTPFQYPPPGPCPVHPILSPAPCLLLCLVPQSPTDSISASSPVSAGPLPWRVFVEVKRAFGSWNGGTVFLHVDLRPVLQYLPKSSQHLQSAVPWVLKFLYPPLQPQALSPNWLFMLQNYVKGFVLSYRLDSVPLNASLKVS